MKGMPLNLRVGGLDSVSESQNTIAQERVTLMPGLLPDQLPSNWPNMLPEPKRYFGQRIVGLRKPNATGWAQGKCPFHEDPAAAFCVNLKWDRPQWQCFAGCGSGSMVDFHMRLHDLDFFSAVAQLLLGDV